MAQVVAGDEVCVLLKTYDTYLVVRLYRTLEVYECMVAIEVKISLVFDDRSE